MSETRDRWVAASTYEQFMGRWSRRLAPRFVSWLRLPAGRHWLDVGCGTGALTNGICRLSDPASVVGCDPSETFVNYARTHSQDIRASYVVASSGNLPARPGGFGSVASLLALNFLPKPQAAVHEMRSRTAPQGTVSACVWDYAGKMEFLRLFWDAAATLDPDARELDEGRRFPLCSREALADLFRECGLSDIRCEPLEIQTVFASFDDYWRPFLGGTGPAPLYVASLDADRRAALAHRLDLLLPRAPDGTTAMTARAWAVRGTAN